MLARGIAVVGMALVVLLGAAAPAQAQSTIDLSQIKDVARAKAEEGLALFANKQWAEAYERFRVAEELFHAPTLGLHMAHCKRELGELLAARALYLEVASEEVPEGAAPAFVKATQEAREYGSQLDIDIPQLTFEVSGASEPRVSVDGVVVDLAHQPLELDPGTHHVDAVAPGTDAYAHDLLVEPGARLTLSIELETTAVATPRPVPSPRPPPPVESGSLVPAFIAFGVGLGGFITGAVAGGIALSRVDAIKAECAGTVCPDSLLGAADDAQLAATVSNIGFIVGGVGAIVGTVLVFVRPGAGDAVSARVHVGPSRLDLEVRF